MNIERIDGQRRVVVSRAIEAPAEEVWSIFRDTTLWPEWGPSVRAVDCRQRYVEAGTRGRVQVPGRLWVPFEITSCAAYRWRWTVARIPATGHGVEPLSEGRCRATIDMPVVAAGYAPVCRRALDRIASLARR